MDLIKERPDAELDDQLGDALNERFKCGDVSHVVIPLLLPVRLPRVKLVCSGKGEILGPNLEREITYIFNPMTNNQKLCGENGTIKLSCYDST